jgi:predicted nucleic acid-binding Zn ribbon protein
MSFTLIGDKTHNQPDKNQSAPGPNTTNGVIEVAQDVFREVFGDSQVELIKPLFFKNRTLTVTCSSSIIAKEIRINHASIVAKINKKLGANEIDRIRYLV